MLKLMKTIFIIITMTFINVMAASAESKNPVILINIFEVPNNQLEETIKLWEIAKGFLENQPGYVSTKLHQSLNPEGKFQLINIAEWETAKDFKIAIQKMKKEVKLPKIKGLNSTPGLYKIIRK